MGDIGVKPSEIPPIVLRVEGMDCADCALKLEKGVVPVGVVERWQKDEHDGNCWDADRSEDICSSMCREMKEAIAKARGG